MKSLSRAIGTAAHRSLRPIRAQTTRNCLIPSASVAQRSTIPCSTVRSYHPSQTLRSILPEVENPAPKESEASERPTVPTDISNEEYNQRADEFLDELLHRLEMQQDKRPDLEVEYSAGVMEISVQNTGTYVLNKQPPNKQIWLSSPVSGPKRFDWVVMGEAMHQKEGAGQGDWIYLRDGTSLTELVRKELGIDLSTDTDVPTS